ncbi:hypothetical protein CKAH01_10402 [Colletotrichum kahawae]|uniref:Acyl-CoA N-acyltransferase n=1 Tax=Colletotrichum kahawae TaxID=34407 RepID=A0AAE0CXD7_COLKA|nr:hypothetical protein CKAH01_10402 [Colletotrichum kahawae]
MTEADQERGGRGRAPDENNRRRRQGSPYPRAIISSFSAGSMPSPASMHCPTTTSSPMQLPIEDSPNEKPRVPGIPSYYFPKPKSPGPKVNEPSQRTSIRWDKNLPLPDRKSPTSPASKIPSSPESPDPIPQKNRNFSCGSDFLLTRGHERYFLARQTEEQDFQEEANSTTSNAPQRGGSLHTDSEMAYSDYSRGPSAFGRPTAPITRVFNEEVERAQLTQTALQSVPNGEQHTGRDSSNSRSSWDVSVDGRSSNDGSVSSRVAPFTHSPIVEQWIQDTPTGIVFSLSDCARDDWEYEFGIDPETGDVMEEVKQPNTMIDCDEEGKMSQNWIHRRRGMTSNALVYKEIDVRAKIMKRQEQERIKNRARKTVKQIQDQAVGRLPQPKEAEKHKVQLLTDYTLRPASLSDSNGCAKTYNLAVTAQEPLSDSTNVSTQHFESIFRECVKEKLPFVIATQTSVDLRDPKNWPSRAAHRQYMQQFQHLLENQPKNDEATICGFGFLVPYEKGLSLTTGAAADTAKVVVFVHPGHRRNGVGSALLHRLLSQTSLMFHGHAQYEWRDPDAVDDGFHRPDFKPIHRIVMHVMVQGKDDKLQWMNKFMKSFQFEPSGRLNQVYKVEKPNGIDWYDQAVWVHWAKNDGNGRTFYAESECSYDYPGKSHSPIKVADSCPRIEFPNGPDYESDDTY